MAVIATACICALLAPVLAPYDPSAGSISTRLDAPWTTDSSGAFHLLGTDTFGRDIFSRLLFGARVSLTIGLVGVALAAFVGTAVGIAAGLGRWHVDSVLMRLVDILLSVPSPLVAIAAAAVIKPTLTSLFFLIGLLFWPFYARLVRAEVLALKTRDFVALARVGGCSTFTVAWRHMLPNVIPSVIVLATFQVGTAIIVEASLSFLGVGLPPETASLGAMVSEGRGVLDLAWWVATFPGVCIFLLILSLNLLGNWARTRFDPRLEGTM